MKARYKAHFILKIVLLCCCLACRPSENRYIDENLKAPDTTSTFRQNISKSEKPGLIYRNPRVYNVEYCFEMFPDPNKIDRSKDLKLWIPIPSQWDSQKAVKIISVEPKPHAEYEDPEHGNRMFFWDFGKESEKPVYSVNLNYRLISHDFFAEIDPNQVGSYDKTGKTYILYTRSTDHIGITPEIKTLAQEAVGDEKNPYLQAKLIFDFVVRKMRYKFLRCDKGTGTKALLDSATIDEQTGEQYYEGQCDQYTTFFVALCRAVGIPARGITGMVGWGPWIKKKDLKLRSERHTRLSPDGLAAARLYGALGGHRWAEFYLPNYGWIPVDATWSRFEWLDNDRVIFTKGTDVLIGPNAPQGDSEGYGDQWIPLHNGRVDAFGWGLWNIAGIRIGKAQTLHHSDPFPADAFAEYAVALYEMDTPGNAFSFDSKQILSSIDNVTRGQHDKKGTLAQAYKQQSQLQYRQQPFICHMLRQIVGDKKFLDIYEAYMSKLVNSEEPVPTERFRKIAEEIYGKPLDWFFEQWLECEELPELKLEDVSITKDEENWNVRINLRQLNDSVFRLPVEIELETEKEKSLKTIWLETKKASFEISSPDKPTRIKVDPKLNILKVQKMPPCIGEFWSFYPELLVVYGTLSEGQANKTATERLVDEFFGLGHQIIKADIDVNDVDLKSKCIILFGRPETNKITQRFQESFPIKFERNKFTWQGVTYDKSTQGVAQIAENPDDARSLIIMYAGLSGDATQKVCDKTEWQKELGGRFMTELNASYIIYDNHKNLVSGDWEDFDSNLVWRPDDSSAPEAANLP